jgi:hypothetical protein
MMLLVIFGILHGLIRQVAEFESLIEGEGGVCCGALSDQNVVTGACIVRPVYPRDRADGRPLFRRDRSIRILCSAAKFVQSKKSHSAQKIAKISCVVPWWRRLSTENSL